MSLFSEETNTQPEGQAHEIVSEEEEEVDEERMAKIDVKNENPAGYQLSRKWMLRLSLIASTAFVSVRQAHLLTKLQRSLTMEEPKGMDMPDHYLRSVARVDFDDNLLHKEYILWSKNDTYFEECRNHFIRNKTWGKARSMLVDKIEAKKIVESLKVPGLKVPPTLAILNQSTVHDFTTQDMLAIPQPYIIKASHTSGGVARVKEGVYNCFKRCENRRNGIEVNVTSGQGLKYFKEQSIADLGREFWRKHNEFQYRDLTPRIIVEQDILVGEMKTDVTFWYMANGKPLFVSLQCGQADDSGPGTVAERVFVSTTYKRLNMHLARGTCEQMPPKPKNWEQQVEIATKVASVAPGVVRLDLYSGGDQVYFSEFTFTTNYCARGVGFHPRVADGLLHAVSHNEIDPAEVTPEFVERVISDTSWAFVSLQPGFRLVREDSKAFPSPIDLCEHVHTDDPKYKSPAFQKDPKILSCLATAKEAVEEPLRCMISTHNNTELRALGVKKQPTFESVMERVDWGRAIVLLLVVTYLTYTGKCVKHERNQFLNNIVYLVFMAGVIYTTTNVEGIFSGNSIITIVKESFRAFVHVHPLESPQIALSHFATYWFYVASWNSKSLRNMLFWQFLIEAFTASINEYTHHTEEQNDVRCMRIAFIGAFKNYAFDNIIRVYILPPFFVFGYMLPVFLRHWLLLALGIAS